MKILFSSQALLTFFATGAADVIWALYIRRTNEGRAVQSAIGSALLWLLAAVVIVNYTTNHYLVIPGALGAFVGTYLTVRLDHAKFDPFRDMNGRTILWVLCPSLVGLTTTFANWFFNHHDIWIAIYFLDAILLFWSIELYFRNKTNETMI